jgi:hypothetical protein
VKRFLLQRLLELRSVGFAVGDKTFEFAEIHTDIVLFAMC